MVYKLTYFPVGKYKTVYSCFLQCFIHLSLSLHVYIHGRKLNLIASEFGLNFLLTEPFNYCASCAAFNCPLSVARFVIAESGLILLYD